MNFQPAHPETQPPRGKYLSRETACIYNDPPRIYNWAHECAHLAKSWEFPPPTNCTVPSNF